MPDPRAFVFGSNGLAGPHARTLREFANGLEASDASDLAGDLRRGDFSRWTREVFGDRALALEIEVQEERHRQRLDADVIPEIAHAIRARYDLADDAEG